MKNLSCLISLLLTWLPNLGYCMNLPTEHRIPGGIAIIPITEFSTTAPLALFNNHKVAVVGNPQDQLGTWLAVVGLPLQQTPGVAYLKVQGNKHKSYMIPFVVKAYNDYKVEHITLSKRKGKQKSDKQLEQKILREAKHLNKILSSWQSQPQLSFQLERPLTGRMTGWFGSRRIINDKPRSPHKGVDWAADSGTTIQAAGVGKVIDIGKYYYTGNTVTIDHGQGFKTIYCHLQNIFVHNGDHVTPADVIGTVGSTGRATGPHLHFGISLNNARVDPKLFGL